MSRRYVDPQFDLFLPYVADLPMRDQRETMERPFFALGKRKRSNPIEYTSPKGDIFVNVYPNPEFGMATIWDADILIWAASTLHNMRRKGVNDIPRTINFHPYDLLTTICRPTGGHQYRLLRGALSRLQATTIQTNIRARRNKKFRQFSWIEGYTEIIYEGTEESIGMSLTLSDWFYEGVMMEGGVLSLDPVYFTITGGRERWLYRVARKHAGGAGAEGFAISLRTLFEKSGAEGTFRRFKYEIQAAICRCSMISSPRRPWPASVPISLVGISTASRPISMLGWLPFPGGSREITRKLSMASCAVSIGKAMAIPSPDEGDSSRLGRPRPRPVLSRGACRAIEDFRLSVTYRCRSAEM